MNTKKLFARRTLPLLLALVMAFGAMLTAFGMKNTASAQSAQKDAVDAKVMTIAVISDVHIIPPSMWAENEDSAAATAEDRKMFAESAAILDAAVTEIIESAPDTLIIPGDLTKDGEYASHVYLAEKLAEIKAALPEINIYVINGNHDINNPHAFDYSSGKAVAAHSATPEEFRVIYNGFGYGDEENEYYVPSIGQAGSNSYVARPAEGFTVIAVDAAKYSADATSTGLDSQQTGGNITAELLAWVLEKAQEADQRGDTVITFMHHGLVPHFSLEPVFLADFLVDNYEETAGALADGGIRYAFTGHMHAQNIASVTTENGNTLYDIETGSLVTYPSPVRFVTFTNGINNVGERFEKVDVSSKFIKEIDYIDPATGEKVSDLTQYGYDNSVDEETIGGLVMGGVAGAMDVTALTGGLLGAEFTTTGGVTHTGARAFFESRLPTEDAAGNPVSNDFGDFMIAMMREMLPSTQATGMSVGDGLATVFYEASQSRIRIAALGGLGNLYITDANLRTHLINPTFIQMDALLADEAYVNRMLGNALGSIIGEELYTDESGNEYAFFDFAKYVYLAHLGGDAVSQPWVDAIIAGFLFGGLSDKVGGYLAEGLVRELGKMLNDIKINTGSMITNDLLGGLFKTTFVNALGGNPAPLGGILDMFGIDFIGMVGGGALDGLLPEEMVAGLGGMIGGLAYSFLQGSGSGIGDNNVVLSYGIESVTASAYVTKLNGNMNNLTITITENFPDGTVNTITETFSINNNAAGTYTVGAYSVYVDTKGNEQIRDCRVAGLSDSLDLAA